MDEMLNQQPQQYQPPEPPKESAGFSIASMVLGIVAILMSCCIYYVAMPCGIVGLVLGALSVKNKKPGKGMAIAGIVMSIISLALAVITIFAAGAILANIPWMSDFEQYIQ